MWDKINETDETPALVEEFGLLEGHEIAKSPRLLPSVEAIDERADDK